MQSLKSTLFQYAPLRRDEHDDSESGDDVEKSLSSRAKRPWLPWIMHGLMFLGWVALFTSTYVMRPKDVLCRDELFCKPGQQSFNPAIDVRN